jgi:hypothetical protein
MVKTGISFVGNSFYPPTLSSGYVNWKTDPLPGYDVVWIAEDNKQ